MHIRTLGGWLSFAVQIASGAAITAYPEYRMLSLWVFWISTVIVFGSFSWWFIANYRLQWPVRKRHGETSHVAISGEATRVQLNPTAVGKFVVLLNSGNALLSECSAPNLDERGWQSKVVEWFQTAERTVQTELTPNESVMFNTVNPGPIIGQMKLETFTCLSGRLNKLRRMVGRLMPDDWTRHPA